jgi:tetratricopeptide (TPR) repeat protein
MMLPLLTALLLIPGAGERDNRRGIEAWRDKDTAQAVKRFEAAAKADTSVGDYAFNAATAKALAMQDPEAQFARALSLSNDPQDRARIHYNRGTSRLRKAQGSPPGQGDVTGAISDLREALKLRPSWQEASRNLDRALRLRPPPQPKQDPKDKDQPKDKPKPDPSGPKPQEPQGSDRKKPQSAPSEGMDPRDAQRLLDGAAAREGQQAKESTRKKNEEPDGPDW